MYMNIIPCDKCVEKTWVLESISREVYDANFDVHITQKQINRFEPHNIHENPYSFISWNVYRMPAGMLVLTFECELHVDSMCQLLVHDDVVTGRD